MGCSSLKTDDSRSENVIDQSDQVEAASEAVFRRFLRGFSLNYHLIMWQMKRAFQICKLSHSSYESDDFIREKVINQSDKVEATSEAIF